MNYMTELTGMNVKVCFAAYQFSGKFIKYTSLPVPTITVRDDDGVLVHCILSNVLAIHEVHPRPKQL